LDLSSSDMENYPPSEEDRTPVKQIRSKSKVTDGK
jgi:hypothetical protein